MSAYNNVLVIGRLARDIELQKTGETQYARISLAVSRDKKQGEEKPEVDFVPCVAFGKTAEVIAKYLKKGQMVGLRGSISVEKKEPYRVSVIVDSNSGIIWLPNGNSSNANTTNQASKNEAPAAAPAPVSQDLEIDVSQDDLPFFNSNDFII